MNDLHVILILLFPLLGFVILGLGFRTLPVRVTAWLGPGTILLSFLMVAGIFFSRNASATPAHYLLFDWITFPGFRLPFSLLIDPLSIVMMLVITGVGFVIHVYATAYMHGDAGFNRFFAYMNLFVFFMLLLVMGDSFPVMFIGWEGVGLSSYLLIGFWYRNNDYSNAAKKAFIMNRIGDLGFLLGMFLIFTTFGSLGYTEVFTLARGMSPGDPVVVTITLLLLLGAVGKSAQIPLFTWLPDAMAGPTPVSALIHAATMVTAGIYMVARSGILFALAPLTLTIMGGVAMATALLAAVIAIFQNDIKKVLAYSTISQLGYMFLALSVGAFTGAMFHLVTHAFFKALLFLGAGSVIHALGGEQDIRKMGGLKGSLPHTWITFLVGTLAIAGIPPLSGFFSKDEILVGLFGSSPLLWVLALAGALLTAFYMFRLLFLTFFSRFRGTEEQRHHLHESPPAMTLPLILLALLAFFGGFINLPGLVGGGAAMEHYLAPVFADAGSVLNRPEPLTHATEWTLMAFTLILVAGSAILAWYRYVKRGGVPGGDGVTMAWIEKIARQRFRIDELLDLLVVQPLYRLAGFLQRVVELRIISRLVDGVGLLVTRTGNTVRYIQSGNVGMYLFLMILGIITILFFNILI